MCRSNGRPPGGADAKAAAEWLIAQWTSRFSEITLSMGDLQPKMQTAQIEEAALRTDLLWWEQSFTCASDDAIWTGAPEETWTEIGTIILSVAGVDPAPAGEIQSTYLEIVRQSMASLAQDISDRIAAPVSTSQGSETPPRSIARYCFQIQAEIPERSIDFYLAVGDGLAQLISSAPEAALGICGHGRRRASAPVAGIAAARASRCRHRRLTYIGPASGCGTPGQRFFRPCHAEAQQSAKADYRLGG